MQHWHRWREPLAVLLLIALAGMLVVRGASLGYALSAGNTGGLFGAILGGDDLLLLAAAAAVLWCATPLPAPADGSTDQGAGLSPHAWPIAVIGLVVVGLTVLGRLALAAWDAVMIASVPRPDVGFVLVGVEGLLRLAVPVAALVAVILAVRCAAAVRSATTGRPELTAATGQRDNVPAVTAPPERLPAAWQADEATGAVWLTADDAAQGRPGLSWSDPAGGSGSAAASGPWAPARPEPDPEQAGSRSSTDTTPDLAFPAPSAPSVPSAPTGPAPAAEDDDLR